MGATVIAEYVEESEVSGRVDLLWGEHLSGLKSAALCRGSRLNSAARLGASAF